MKVPVIALVEDDAALRQALADLFEVVDLNCFTFESAEGFLAAYAPGRFDCLLTDLNLQGESGLQLLERLQVLEPALPVIVISAQTDPATQQQAIQAGARAYLRKPLNDQVLLAHLDEALGRGPADAPAAPP